MAKKKKDEPAADGDGKKKAPPTEVEREELRVRITALEEKLSYSTTELERVQLDHGTIQEKLKKQQEEQMEIVAYLKKEIEKKDTELAALMDKYVLLREEKEAEETRLAGEREKAVVARQEMGDANDKSLGEVHRLTDQLIDYDRLKQQSVDDSNEKATLKRKLQQERDSLEETRQQLAILAAPDGDKVGESGKGAVLLLLLEAMRMYSTKPVLHEQASDPLPPQTMPCRTMLVVHGQVM